MYEELRIVGVEFGACFESFDELCVHGFDLLDFVGVLVGVVVGDDVWVDVKLFVFGVEDEPLFEVVHRFYFIQNIGAGYAQRKEGV